MFKIKNIINFLEIIFIYLLCFIFFIFYKPFNNQQSINIKSYSTTTQQTTQNSFKLKQSLNEIDEVYILKQQRKVLIDLLKEKNLDYMKNKFLNDIYNIDIKLQNLNANMDDIDIIIF